jgi:hypothetical protein
VSALKFHQSSRNLEALTKPYHGTPSGKKSSSV